MPLKGNEKSNTFEQFNAAEITNDVICFLFLSVKIFVLIAMISSAHTYTRVPHTYTDNTILVRKFVTDLKQLAGNTVCLVRSDIVIVVAVVVIVVEVNEYERANCLANCCAHEIQPQMIHGLFWRSSEITLSLIV